MCSFFLWWYHLCLHWGHQNHPKLVILQMHPSSPNSSAKQISSWGQLKVSLVKGNTSIDKTSTSYIDINMIPVSYGRTMYGNLKISKNRRIYQ